MASRRRRAIAEHAGIRLRLRRHEPGRHARSRRRQRPHRRDRSQHPRQCRLRAAAAAVPESGQAERSGMSRPQRAADSPSRESDAAWRTAISTATATSISLVTTNGGPASLFRNDQVAGNRSIRFRLVGTKSNRDAIGASVRITSDGVTQTRIVKSGSSYLSQSELPVDLRPGQTRSRRPRGRDAGRAGGPTSSKGWPPVTLMNAWRERGSARKPLRTPRHPSRTRNTYSAASLRANCEIGRSAAQVRE